MQVPDISKEQLFFSVFCIESLSDALKISGDRVYKMLTEKDNLLDNYIIKHYEPLHTQGKDYIVRELIELLQERGAIK